jgi:hypothetical protein
MKLNKFIVLLALAILALATLACGQYTVGSIQALETALPTVIDTNMPTVKENIIPLATHAPNIKITVGSWHLRSQPSPDGMSVIIPDGTTVDIVQTVEVSEMINGEEIVTVWYLVQTIEENPDDVRGGFIHSDCCNE